MNFCENIPAHAWYVCSILHFKLGNSTHSYTVWPDPIKVKVVLPLNVNVVKKDLLNKNIFGQFYDVRSERGGFQLM